MVSGSMDTISAGTSSAFSRIARPSANRVFSTRNRPTAGRTSFIPRKPSLCTWLAPSRLPSPITSILSTPDSWVDVKSVCGLTRLISTMPSAW